MKKFKKVLVVLLSVAFVLSLFGGCAKTDVKNEVKNEDSKVIMRTGMLTTMKATNYENDPVYPTYYYDDLNSMILAYQSGKIESIFNLPYVVAKYVANSIDGTAVVEPQVTTGMMGLCIGTLNDNTEVYNLFNNAIEKLLDNGTIAKLSNEYLNKYVKPSVSPEAVDMVKIEGAKTVRIAVTGDMPPVDLVTFDGRPAGFNIALLSEIAKLTNVNIELVQMNSGARLTALKTNTVDAVFCNIQYKMDDNKYDEISKEDLPDEVIVTKPYYSSRIYEVDSIKKLDELVSKGIIEPQKNVLVDDIMNCGALSYASLTEEEQNDRIDKYGWEINAKFYDNLNQMLLALKSGQIDHISVLPKSTAKYIKARNDDIVIRKTPVEGKIKYSMATLEENKEVYNILNDTLNDIIKDGTIEKIKKKYIDEFIEDKDNPRAVDMPHYDDAKTIKVAVTGDLPPFDYVSSDGEPAGYNVALLSEIAKRAKLNVELVAMDEKAKITALVTKNIDVVFWLNTIEYADDRNTFYDCPKGVSLTDSYYQDDIYMLYSKDGKIDKRFSANQSEVIMKTGNLASMNPVADPENEYEGFPTYYYDDYNSLILAYQSEKIDSMYSLPEVVAKYIENHIDGVKAQEPLKYSGVIDLCIGTLKERTETYNLLNNAIDELLNNGTIDKLNKEYLDKYLRTKEEPKAVELPKIDGAQTLKIAVTGDMPPIDYIAPDGKPAGFNVALLSEISKIANVNFDLVQVNSATRLDALKVNDVDALFYTFKQKWDNKEYEDGQQLDIPDEVVVTKPYYTSRVYEVDSIKKTNELIAKGVPETLKEIKKDKKFYSGMLAWSSATEEEKNNLMAIYGWSIGVKYYDDLNSMILALKAGQIDNMAVLPKSTAEYIKARNDEVVISKSNTTGSDKIKYNMATLEDNKEIYNLLNDTLNDIIKDGTIENIKKKYIDEYVENKEEPKVVDMPHYDNAKTIKIAITGNLPPFDFVSSDGRPAGYNVALLSEIANRAKVNIELVPMNEGAKVTALVAGRIDAIFWLSGFEFADERNIVYDCPAGVIMTDCYYEDDAYNVYPKDGKVDKLVSANQ